MLYEYIPSDSSSSSDSSEIHSSIMIVSESEEGEIEGSEKASSESGSEDDSSESSYEDTEFPLKIDVLKWKINCQSIKLLKPSNKPVLDINHENFGYDFLYFLKEIDQEKLKSLKGYPCIAYDENENGEKINAVSIKIVPLSRNFKLNNHPNLNEPLILKILNNELKTETPHIVKYYDHEVVKNNIPALCKLPLKLLQRFVYNNSLVIVSELFQGDALDAYMEDHLHGLSSNKGKNKVKKFWKTNKWRKIIFSVLWTLHVWQKEKYKMCHNDLHVGNVLLKHNSLEPHKKTFYYKDDFNNLSFKLNDLDFELKIWDYEFSKMFAYPNANHNSHVEERRDVPFEFNNYYDLHTFLASLYFYRSLLPKEVVSFIKSLYPEELLENQDSFDSDISEREFDYYLNEPEDYFWKETDNLPFSHNAPFLTGAHFAPNLLNGIEASFNLPSPIEILKSHSFFDPLRVGSNDTIQDKSYEVFTSNGK